MNHLYPHLLSVPVILQDEYCKNMTATTRNTDKVFIFACDQKIEHLHSDFVGRGMSSEVADPRHCFEIAQAGFIGAMALPLGLLTRYGHEYKDINYIVKLSGKTNLVPQGDRDPLNGKLWTVHDVIRIKNEHDISICGVGCTVYIGSEYELEMLAFAADMIQQAHHNGLIAMLWVYPRGKSISDPEDPLLLAGVAGLANALGADIVKIHAPGEISDLPMIVRAAGNTKVVCAGGAKVSAEQLLQGVKQAMGSP